MNMLLCIVSLLLALVSCERRTLVRDYAPTTVQLSFAVDWSDMSTTPTGMSIYCYPESGESPTIIQTNTINSTTAKLVPGRYDILIFNQIPTDYGTLIFSGMDLFKTATVSAVSTKSSWATSKADDSLVRDPEELATATYIDFDVAEADELGTTQTLVVAPKVIIKTTRVRIRVSGINNHQSTRATLYGMASGHHFSGQVSLDDEVTHVLEDWSVSTYEDISEGELTISFTSFGLPGQTTTTRSYEDWDGQLDIEMLLVDNETIISETIMLNDKVTITESEDDSTKADVSTDVDIDLSIDFGFGADSDDDPIVLPDVTPAGSTGSGFDAEIGDWGDNVGVDVPL